MDNKLRMMDKALESIDTNDDFINCLPVECLFHVFSFLNVEDRLRSTTVCRRWRGFGSDAWRDVEKLDLISLQKLETEHLRLLALCGGFLNDLTVPVPKDSNIIQVVTRQCSNLIKFRVRFESYRGNKAEHCKHLAALFAKNKASLQNLVIDNMSIDFVCYTDWILELSEKLVELQLWGFMAHSANSNKFGIALFTCFIPAIKRMKNLEILVLNGLTIIYDELRIIESFGKLRHLEIYGCNLHSCNTRFVARCRELKYLSVQFTETTDAWIDNLVQNNPDLQHLKLEFCNLSEVANRKLFELCKLETLNLKWCWNTNPLDLSGFPNLKKFIFTNIQDSQIITLMRTASRLEFVESNGYKNSPEILKTAHEVTCRRVNAIPLHIVVPVSLIQQWRMPERLSPLLKVESTEDYCTRTENEYTGYGMKLFY